MILSRNTIFILLLLFTSKLFSQNSSGIITYKGLVNEKFVDSFLVDLKKKDMPMASKQTLVEALTNSQPEEFILKIKNNESYYHHIPSLKQEGFYMGSRAGITPYYTNNVTDTIIKMSRSLGYISQPPIDWQLTNKTKMIGDYKCYKASIKEKLYSRQGYYYYKDVYAWFTPEIPLNFGPKHYKGLPGLILQIEDNEYTLTATKINLNPSEEFKIERPKKNAKVITQQESFDRIKEMEEDRRKSFSAKNQ